jgi:serine protease Do
LTVDPLAALVSRTQNGVIRIETATCTGGGIRTGFLIGDYLIATVEHLVDGAASIELRRNGHVQARC